MSAPKRAQTAMYEHYGNAPSGYCKQCCNLHFAPVENTKDRICIAFGYREDTDCIWDPEACACGIFNTPFSSLRPARVPLVEVVFSRGKSSGQEDEDDGQVCLF